MRNKNTVKQLQNYLLQMGAKLPKFGADGDLGGETKAAIDSLEVPEYVKIALKEVGIYEIVGKLHSARVLEYQATTAGKYTDDETPWCGAFISWVMKQAGIAHGIKVPERAKEWINFGYAVNEPTVGSVAVKSRVGGGHVCIVVGQHPNGKLYCLGGNQNNEVNIALYDRNVFEAFRNIESTNKLCVVNLHANQKVSEA
jgi:uncharacterized protein (TIGR02594 family)